MLLFALQTLLVFIFMKCFILFLFLVALKERIPNFLVKLFKKSLFYFIFLSIRTVYIPQICICNLQVAIWPISPKFDTKIPYSKPLDFRPISKPSDFRPINKPLSANPLMFTPDLGGGGSPKMLFLGPKEFSEYTFPFPLENGRNMQSLQKC